jgi:hypothetical protein
VQVHPFDSKTAQALLLEATTKLIELRQQIQWQDELPSRCPPILWFGNACTAKPRVLTIGANPSRREYLHDTSRTASQKVQQTGDDSLLRYRESPDNRFRLLNKGETLADILTNQTLQADIITGYNAYFSRNPYTWFGHSKSDSYNVEGFLRGFGATYFDQVDTAFRAIHIDLFPFATLKDFNALQHLANKDLFSNEWAQRIVISLIRFLAPTVLLIFGRTNFHYFASYIDRSLTQHHWYRDNSRQYCLGTGVRFNIPVIGLSTNLGNPKGFTKASLRQYGEYIRQQISIP